MSSTLQTRCVRCGSKILALAAMAAVAVSLTGCGVSDKERALERGTAGPEQALRARLDNQADR